MIDHRTRAALKADIAAHLLTSGGAGWTKVRDRYPNISAATFWRMLREVKLEQQAQSHNSDADGLQEPAGARMGPGESLALAAIPWLQSGLTPTRLFERYAQLLKDADDLRAYSVDASGKITRPATFAQSIKMREQLLGACLQVQRGVPASAHHEQVLRELGELVWGVDVELQQKLVAAMRAVSEWKKDPAPDWRS